MTYEQIEMMDKDDLVYAFKRMMEIAEKAANVKEELEAKYNDIQDEGDAHGHIGRCEAQYNILKMELDSVIDVVTNS
jgi:hypothetical protein